VPRGSRSIRILRLRSDRGGWKERRLKRVASTIRGNQQLGEYMASIAMKKVLVSGFLMTFGVVGGAACGSSYNVKAAPLHGSSMLVRTALNEQLCWDAQGDKRISAGRSRISRAERTRSSASAVSVST
jgi:hypothetical protein